MGDMSRRADAAIRIANDETLDVRWFRIREKISTLTSIDVSVQSGDPDLDLRDTVGQSAFFQVTGAGARRFDGIVATAAQVRVEETGLSAYQLTLVPRLWLLSQRTNYRAFQNQSELAIAKRLLTEWGIDHVDRCKRSYERRSFVLQYGESDFAFARRLLADAGIAFTFEFGSEGLAVVIDDAMHAAEERSQPIPYHDTPADHLTHWVRRLEVRREVRPARIHAFDVDYRRPPDAQPAVRRGSGLASEESLEIVGFEPGSFLFEQDGGSDTPAADDRGIARTVMAGAEHYAETKLLAARAGAILVSFEASVADFVPGTVRSISHHPHRDVSPRPLLVLENVVEGGWDRDIRARVVCTHVDVPYRPPQDAPCPRVQGLESATVVGPAGTDIHTDEFGRVRLQFHWDRYGERDEYASCWVPVSQAWGGAGFGAVALPRVGQEVLVQFLGGNPNRPIVVGRVFTTTNPAPYALPGLKEVSGLRSKTTGLAAQALGAMLNVAKGLLGGPAKPIAPSDLAAALDHPHFGAKSPDAATHNWLGSELTFHDQPGGEQVFLQAQRDFRSIVKNAATHVIGNSQATHVGTDDVLVVGNRQSCDVGDDQTMTVGGDRTVLVQGAETLTTVQDLSVTTHANLTVSVTGKHASTAAIAEHEATDLMVLKVGASRVVLRPDFIILQATDVFINPGDADTDAAIQNGTRPLPETEKRAAEEARQRARIDAAVERVYEPDAPQLSSDPDVNFAVDDMILSGRDQNPDFLADGPEYLRGMYGRFIPMPSGALGLSDDQIGQIMTLLEKNK